MFVMATCPLTYFTFDVNIFFYYIFLRYWNEIDRRQVHVYDVKQTLFSSFRATHIAIPTRTEPEQQQQRETKTADGVIMYTQTSYYMNKYTRFCCCVRFMFADILPSTGAVLSDSPCSSPLTSKLHVWLIS